MTYQFLKHYLLSKRAGSFIRVMAWACIVGICFSIMSLVVVSSIMNGLNNSLRDKMIQSEAHLIVKLTNKSAAGVVGAVGAVAEQNMIEDLSRILKEFNPKSIESFESQELVFKTLKGSFGWAVGEGLSKGSIQTPLNKNEVILGESLARSLHIFEGDELVVSAPEILLLPAEEIPKAEKVRVKKIISTGIEHIDNKLLIYDKEQSLTRLRNTASYEKGYRIYLKDPNDVDKAQLFLTQKNFDVESWKDRNKALIFALKLEKIVMMIFLSLAALITCFSIITVLTLLLTQKRKDISLMLAMGSSKKEVEKLFLKIGLFLSFIGLGGGLLIGIILSLLVSHISASILPDFYYESVIPSRIDFQFLFYIFIGAAFVAALSSWLPVKFGMRNSVIYGLKA